MARAETPKRNRSKSNAGSRSPSDARNIKAGNQNIIIVGNVTSSNLASMTRDLVSSKQRQGTGKRIPKLVLTRKIPAPGDLPSGSYLPFSPNPLFTGRLDDLKQLADALIVKAQSGMVITQAITGMGGLGKTQLAVEFAYRYGRYFWGVHWLNLADPATLDSEIALNGSKMRLKAWPDEQPRQVTMTENVWKAEGPRLLILDNFEEVADASKLLPRFRHSNIRLLITSRRSDWPATTGLALMPLDLFTKEESLVFLKEFLQNRKDTSSALRKLADRLGYLPLALELASRYLNSHPRLRISEYLDQATDAIEHPSMKDWRQDLPASTHHDLNLQRTFALSWQAVKDETARQMFQIAGYLAPNTAIPVEIFEKTLEISSETCDESLAQLYGVGLLSRIKKGRPIIHPLLAEFARHLAQEVNQNIFELLATALRQSLKEAIDAGSSARSLGFRLHIPMLATHAEKRNPKLAGTLWNSYGYHLQLDVADYANAIIAYEQALKIREAMFGPNHSEVGTVVNNLGKAKQAQGNFSGARAAFERALKIREAAFGPDHPEVAVVVNQLGRVLMDEGDLIGAKRAYERAREINETSLGHDNPEVARNVNNIGTVLEMQGDLGGARAAFERALKINEAAFDPDHFTVAIVVSNLGNILRKQGDLPGARSAYERALKIDKAFYGGVHPNVGIRLNNLGMVLQEEGNKDGARANYRRALRIFKRHLFPGHPFIKEVQENLASLE